MSNSKPYSGSSQQRLADLLNADNNTNYVLGEDFEFGAISEYSDSSGRNTTIELIPTGNHPRQLINYTRLSLNIVQQENPVNVVVPFSTHEVLDSINAQLGLDLTPDEVVDVVYQTEQATYPLTIDESVAWLNGSSVDFTANHDLIDVNDVVTTLELDGLVWN